MIVLNNYIESALCQFLDGNSTIECDRLHTRSDQRGGLFRLTLENEGTVIVKVWRIRNLKERLKSIARLSNGWREWSMHRQVHQAGIFTPEPIGFFRFTTLTMGNVEAMVMEDIGAVTKSLDLIKRLIADGDEAAVISIEDRMIDLTASLIKLNIIDIDHQLNNLVVDSAGKLIRIDFECARKRLQCLRSKSELAKMIARFLTGHIYAVQPDLYRTLHFAERLYKRIGINSSMKIKINNKVDENMSSQLAHNGVDTKVKLPA